MGWCVISEASIEIYIGAMSPATERKIKEVLKEEEVYSLCCKYGNFSFSVSGNKRINYEFLDKIKQLLKDDKEVKVFEITASEFVESNDGGYRYNSDEDED